MQELVAWVARGLVDDPAAVRVERVALGDTVLLRLHVAPADVARVIGRHGRIVRALRTVARAASTRNERVTLEIAEP